MITGIDVVTVYVSDQNAALDFFVNKLGLEKRTDAPFGSGWRWLEVAPHNSHTRIVLAKDFGGDAAGKIGTFTGLVFSTHDFQTTYQQMLDKGVVFTEPPAIQDFGVWQAQFQDPDRNGFVLVGA